MINGKAMAGLLFWIPHAGQAADLIITTILTLGLGIRLATTVFSIVNGVIFKGLPFEEADRISLESTNPSRAVPRMEVSVHDYVVWHATLGQMPDRG